MITSVLLDRDGTIITDKHYLADPDGVELLPGAAEGLRMLSDAQRRLFFVTNQSGIGRGYFGVEAYNACSAAMGRLLDAEGVRFEGGMFCPHAPEAVCFCRKPAVGMWHALRDTYGLAAKTSAMIGDKPEDIAFGLAAGFPVTVLVLTGKGSAAAETMHLPPLEAGEMCRVIPPGEGVRPHAVARNLAGAAQWILGLRS